MSPSNHTPGPWEAMHDADGDYGIFDSGPRPLATTYTDRPEDAANASLMAAAPDLLAAAEMVLDFARSDWKDKPNRVGVFLTTEQLKTIESAIGRALECK